MDRERPSAVLDDDGMLHVRASAWGGCLNALAYVAGGGERTAPPEFLQQAMDESGSLEDQAMALVADDQNWDSDYHHPDYGSFTLGSVVLEGGTDFEHGDGFMVEIKTVGEKLYDELLEQFQKSWDQRTGLAVKYTWQLAAYRTIYELPMRLGLAEKDRHGLTGRATAIEDTRPPTGADVIDRIKELKALVDADELQCDGQSGWCEAEMLCKPEPVVLDVDIDLNLISALKAKAVAAADAHREAQDALAAKVREAGGRAVTPEGHKMTWVETHVVEKKPREYDRRYLKITRNKHADE